MHYLECITLLNYLLKKLNAEQRVQVPVSACDEVASVIIQLNKKLEGKQVPAVVTTTLEDLYSAVTNIKKSSGLLCLTEEMKSALLDSINRIKISLSLTAYRYFQQHDEIPDNPSDTLVGVLREVVWSALQEGII